MKMVLRHAAVMLDGNASIMADQTVAIFQNTAQAIIGIDGHAGFRDELVEIRWEGCHRQALAEASHVEIRDRDGHVMTSLPVNRTREPVEKDGETVFYLTDKE
jgi:hypothetical protein